MAQPQNVYQLRFKSIGDLRTVAIELMQLRHQYGLAADTLYNTGYTSGDLIGIVDFVRRIANEAKLRVEERQKRRPQQEGELDRLIKEARLNERFMTNMKHVAARDPYAVAGNLTV